MTSALAKANNLLASEFAFRVITRTLKDGFWSNERATAPPWLPVAPMIAITEAMTLVVDSMAKGSQEVLSVS